MGSLILNTLYYSNGLNPIEGKYSDESVSFNYPLETFPYVQTPESAGGNNELGVLDVKAFHSKEDNIRMFFSVIEVDNNWTLKNDYELFMKPSNLTNDIEFIDINGTEGLLIHSKQDNAPINYKYSSTLIFIKDNKKYHFQIISGDLKLLNSTFNTIKASLKMK